MDQTHPKQEHRMLGETIGKEKRSGSERGLETSGGSYCLLTKATPSVSSFSKEYSVFILSCTTSSKHIYQSPKHIFYVDTLLLV